MSTDQFKEAGILIKWVLVGLGRPVYRGLILLGRISIGLIKVTGILGRSLIRFLSGLVRKFCKLSTNRPARLVWLRSKQVAGVGLLVVLAMGGMAVYGGWKEIEKDFPDINKIYNPPLMSSKVVDRNGQVLYKFYINENRSWTPIERIPEALIWATLSVEDKDFFSHHGFSFRGITKAVWYNLNNKEEKMRGGSTITQQLAKNVFLNNEKTWNRKIKETLLSILIEQRLSKREILERYFNQVAYGGETYGVEEAALKYFGKHIWEITVPEAAFLAGLPAAPSTYYPYGPNKELAFARQRHVIDQMVDAGYISTDYGNNLKNTPLQIKEDKKDIKAPHFVFYVKEYLEKHGFSGFEGHGLTIRTTLDMDLQNRTQETVTNEVNSVKRLRISNGGALVLDVKTGDVLAMVGSKGYEAKDIDGKYNVTTALRQPGSSIKPINYLVALMKGWTMGSAIEDTPVRYEIKGQKPYIPQNYNGRFMGTISLKTALASSLNIPSVKLLDNNGVKEMIIMGRKMGITSWNDENRFGLSLALGSGEVRMTELAGAYSIFANSGKKVDLNPILEIQNYLGETIYEKQVEPNEVFEEEFAYLINDALSDNLARAPVFGVNSKLQIEGKKVAVKTGTTNSMRDNWCIGWTPSILVAAWVGNNDNTPMAHVASGVSGATPIWNRIMNGLLEGRPNEEWELPENIIKKNVCGREGLYVRGTEERVKCPSRANPSVTQPVNRGT